jgi:hypothetical protein
VYIMVRRKTVAEICRWREPRLRKTMRQIGMGNRDTRPLCIGMSKETKSRVHQTTRPRPAHLCVKTERLAASRGGSHENFWEETEDGNQTNPLARLEPHGQIVNDMAAAEKRSVHT